MRHYDDPVEVRRASPAEVSDPAGRQGDGPPTDAGPEQFLWRGRLWKVRCVLDHSRESIERERWRVRAGRGGLERDGDFDLALDRADGSWRLVGAVDRPRPLEEARP
ncbi:DUF6504 family protein [Nocardioides litoris]|uniref:DUF6504 family protein n=1 Tax=Nocardioides litoris TaxID=1926648 RepID=UPI00111EB82C|nr:DUF6504 family protein [Nocardioides litoris]